MGRLYKNPPLVEALCEFRFEDKGGWDMTLPGLLYAELKDEFPLKQERSEVQVQVNVKAASPADVKSNPKAIFKNEDETRLVQVSPGILVVNHLDPYPTWDRFKEMIFDVFRTYQTVAHPSRLARIGLRYINRIDLGEGQQASDCFNYFPTIPEPIARNPDKLLLRTELPFPDQNGLLLLTLASAQEDGVTAGFVLDLDFITLDASMITFENAAEWVECAHDQVELAFEATVTDSLRERFEEIEQ